AAIGMIGPERTAIIGNVSPVVTVSLAISVLGENFTVWHAAGTALVLLGVWLFGRKQAPKRSEVEAAEVGPEGKRRPPHPAVGHLLPIGRRARLRVGSPTVRCESRRRRTSGRLRGWLHLGSGGRRWCGRGLRRSR